MELEVALPEISSNITEDVCLRLGVIFPNFMCEIRQNKICLSGVPETDEVHIRQTVLDQIIRSKQAARTAPLRNLLYGI